MNREIKFRMWDSEDQKMKHLHTMFAPGAYRDSGTRTSADYNFQISEREILMQFTGLRDKNGREIYEGDLVVCYLSGARIGAVDTVIYNDESAAFEFKRRCATIKSFLEHDGLFDTEIEVIGNIYENKKLENA